MIEITVTCSHCGKFLCTEEGNHTIELDTVDQISPQFIADQIKKEGWEVQFNGDHLDTYCSQRCAR